MTDLRKAAEMALEALCSANPIGHALEDYEYHNKATEALRQAIEQAEYDKLTIKFGERAKEYLEGAKKSWEQEPVAWLSSPNFIEQETVEGRPRRVWFECNSGVGIPLYTAPSSKPWVSLTEEESSDIYNAHHNTYGECITSAHDLVLDVEANLKEKNT